MTKLETHQLGSLKKAARYLGAFATHNLSTQTVVDKRCHAAKEAFYGMGRAWKTSISLKTKAGVFKGQVVNTLLSGLEAETLRTCDFDKLEKCQMQLARTLVGSLGVYVGNDGNK